MPPKTNRTLMSSEEEARILELRSKGLSCNKIAEIIGRSPGAINGFRLRHGLLRLRPNGGAPKGNQNRKGTKAG